MSPHTRPSNGVWQLSWTFIIIRVHQLFLRLFPTQGKTNLFILHVHFTPVTVALSPSSGQRKPDLLGPVLRLTLLSSLFFLQSFTFPASHQMALPQTSCLTAFRNHLSSILYYPQCSFISLVVSFHWLFHWKYFTLQDDCHCLPTRTYGSSRPVNCDVTSTRNGAWQGLDAP